jgi:hypothetical protein
MARYVRLKEDQSSRSINYASRLPSKKIHRVYILESDVSYDEDLDEETLDQFYLLETIDYQKAAVVDPDTDPDITRYYEDPEIEPDMLFETLPGYSWFKADAFTSANLTDDMDNQDLSSLLSDKLIL